MTFEPQNPLNMNPDPYAGDTFILPETECTSERRLFFKRMNEIQAFLFITKMSFDVCKKQFEGLIPKLTFQMNTPIKLAINDSNCVYMPASRIIEMTTEGINLLTRQALVMFYGSFETYLYQLFERSFPIIGITEDILDKSRDILMRKQWDGKFCTMSNVFDIGYKANDLINRFKGFELTFEGTKHKNPLHFLDELSQVRHRIVHASSILDKDKLILIDINIFHGFFCFFFLLTDYVDNLFASKFSYSREKLNPGEA